MNVFALAPRLMINLADLPATGLIQNGSRIRYRLHLAGEDCAGGKGIRGLGHRPARAWRKDRKPGQRAARDPQRHRARAALPAPRRIAGGNPCRGGRGAGRRTLYAAASRRLRGDALHGRVGSATAADPRRRIPDLRPGRHAGRVRCRLCGAGRAGTDAGEPDADQTAGSITAALAARLLVGLTLVIGFALPPLLRLKRVPTIRVLRREWSASEPASVGAYLLGAAGACRADVVDGGGTAPGPDRAGGFLIALAFFALMARVLLAGLGRLRPAGRGYGWRHGLVNLRRRLAATMVQAVALALGLTALLLLTVARGDLLDSWLERVPADAPNRFAINIQPDQRVAIADFFKARGLPPPELEPMVRGRLVQVNSRAGRSRELRRRSRAAPGRSRIQPLLVGAASGRQHRQRRALARRDANRGILGRHAATSGAR
jgi:putative ABC transport system permease protein